MDGFPNLPLIFNFFPESQGKISWISLGEFPTPIQKLEKLGARLGLNQLYCKRDDLTHSQYGGNKVRKLEFLLAEAKKLNKKFLLTLGAWGSNHILATTFFGKQLGLKTIAIMVPQPAQEYARKNILITYALGCELNYAKINLAVPAKIIKIYLNGLFKREPPYFIWAGGSNPLGTLGYVNAGLEIGEQVKKGILPEPDYIFCAVGSCGTFTGLVLGIKRAGLKSKVLGVRVYEKWASNAKSAYRLGKRALALLKARGAKLSDLKISLSDFLVLHQYAGKGYAHFTKVGVEAMKMAYELEGIKLEGTYTGKALSALIDLAGKNELKNKVALFINSYNSNPIEKIAPVLPDWRELPKEFHHCFLEQILEPEE